MGGPMMGIAQVNIDAVVIKATSGIVAIAENDVDYKAERACIRCGRCIEACTMHLRPNMLSILSERGSTRQRRPIMTLWTALSADAVTMSALQEEILFII